MDWNKFKQDVSKAYSEGKKNSKHGFNKQLKTGEVEFKNLVLEEAHKGSYSFSLPVDFSDDAFLYALFNKEELKKEGFMFNDPSVWYMYLDIDFGSLINKGVL